MNSILSEWSLEKQAITEPAEYPALQQIIDDTAAHLNALTEAVSHAEQAIIEIAGPRPTLANVGGIGGRDAIESPVKQSRIAVLGEQVSTLRSLTTRVEELARRLRAI